MSHSILISLLLTASAGVLANTPGKPYFLKGRHYQPFATVDPGFTQVGTASCYDIASNFGVDTASGEHLDNNAMTAASPILPMNTKVKVTNLANNKSLILRINDRGPYNSIHGAYKSERIIDLTCSAAHKLGYEDEGTTKVKVTVVS